MEKLDIFSEDKSPFHIDIKVYTADYVEIPKSKLFEGYRGGFYKSDGGVGEKHDDSLR